MTPTVELITADCLEWMRGQPDDRFDLVFGSPPDDATLRNNQRWADWAHAEYEKEKP